MSPGRKNWSNSAGPTRSSRPWSNTSRFPTSRRPLTRTGWRTAIWMRPPGCSSAGRGRSSLLLLAPPLKSPGCPGARRSSSSMFPARARTRFYSTAISTQPEMAGWTEGYGPWIPRPEGDKLNGRGGADDGYAMFGALGALMALKEQRVPRARTVVLIEACEESGSYDLPYYVDHLAGRIGSPSLVVCLDSGCGNARQGLFEPRRHCRRVPAGGARPGFEFHMRTVGRVFFR